MEHLLKPKGYTMIVHSWENDGDYNNTTHTTYEDLDVVKALVKLLELCQSRNRTKGLTLGNTYANKFSEQQSEMIQTFFENNPILLDGFEKKYELDQDFYIDLFFSFTHKLLGASDDYLCRVFESCTVIYSDEDIKCQIIEL